MASDLRCLLLSPENAPFDEFIFSIKFCEIFQGFIKKIPGLFQGFQGFPGLQKFSRVFQDFQGPYEPCMPCTGKCAKRKIGILLQRDLSWPVSMPLNRASIIVLHAVYRGDKLLYKLTVQIS